MTGSAPTHPSEAAGEAAPAARTRGRRWGWIAVAVVAGLAVAAVGAEALARGVVVQTIRDQAASGFGVSPEQVNADVPGVILRQLVAGSLNDVRVDVGDVSVGGAASVPVSILSLIHI